MGACLPRSWGLVLEMRALVERALVERALVERALVERALVERAEPRLDPPAQQRSHLSGRSPDMSLRRNSR
jgi:hypothetical protein